MLNDPPKLEVKLDEKKMVFFLNILFSKGLFEKCYY